MRSTALKELLEILLKYSGFAINLARKLRCAASGGIVAREISSNAGLADWLAGTADKLIGLPSREVKFQDEPATAGILLALLFHTNRHGIRGLLSQRGGYRAELIEQLWAQALPFNR